MLIRQSTLFSRFFREQKYNKIIHLPPNRFICHCLQLNIDRKFTWNFACFCWSRCTNFTIRLIIKPIEITRKFRNGGPWRLWGSFWFFCITGSDSVIQRVQSSSWCIAVPVCRLDMWLRGQWAWAIKRENTKVLLPLRDYKLPAERKIVKMIKFRGTGGTGGRGHILRRAVGKGTIS